MLTPMTPDEILNHQLGWRYGYYLFHMQINEWASQLEPLLLTTTEKLPGHLEKMHEMWLNNLILDFRFWIEYKDVVPGKIRVFPGMDIFVELSRTYYLISREQVETQRKELNEAMFKTTLEHSNMHCFKMNHTDHFSEGFHKDRLDWEKPVLEYTRQEVMDALLMITEKIDQLPSSAVSETRYLLRLLYIRHAQLVCTEKDLTRDYLTFTTIYFVAIQRRFFYWDLMPQKKYEVPPETTERCRQWIIKDVYNRMTDESFDDIYKNTYEEEAYVFPGDLDWYNYRYPDLPNFQIGPILGCFRTEMMKKYFSEYRISKETLLDSVNQNSHTGHCARLFMFNAIDQYISISMNTKWKDTLVISNNMLESCSKELLREYGVTVPYFVQIFSRYCIYDVGNIYVTDNFYESLVIWLSLIRDKKNWHVLIDKIIKGYEAIPEYIGSF